MRLSTPLWPALALAALAALAAMRNIAALLPPGTGFVAVLAPDPDMTGEMLLHYTVLPRIAVALMAGGALGLSGTILQRILRNPLAEPATLGISAGAYLAMAVATLWFPAALSQREWVAFAGAGAALAAILALAWRRGLSPVTVTLAGMIVSLYCGAVSAVLTLFNHDFLVGLFLWGAGHLDQQDWGDARFLAPRLLVASGIALLLLRPLTLLALNDESARSLGLPLAAYRLAALIAAAALTATVTASVGVIGFVGLAAPTLARACGVRQTGPLLLWSGVIGALLLLATDQLVLGLPVTYRLFPTGAVTALLGAPLLFLLIRRLKLMAPPQLAEAAPVFRLGNPLAAILILVMLVPGAAWLATALGQGPEGWSLALGDAYAHLLGWRGPRVLAAFAGGAMLALAGAVLQRMSGNPLASPEVLGVSSGAMLGTVALLLAAPAPTRTDQILAGSGGAMAVLLLMLALSRRPDFAGERLLLIGITLGSVSGFVMAVLMAAQDPRLGQVLAWMSGSTYAVRPAEAGASAALLLAALLLLPALRRWLDLLPLGTTTASAAGMPLTLSRGVLYALSAVLTAAATILVGPLSFAGLMGPHLARLAGFQRAGTHLAAAALLGGLILLTADWLGRNLIFPFQVPAGLFAAVVGGPFLLVLIARNR
ncbi:Fe(3+)-hydroxamate ABC transporter permease FhuB [Pseudochelatococcus sp. B33]